MVNSVVNILLISILIGIIGLYGFVESRYCGHPSKNLPDSFYPTHYDIKHDPAMLLSKFNGHVNISIGVREKSRKIIMHLGPNMRIESTQLFLAKEDDPDKADDSKQIRIEVCQDFVYELYVIEIIAQDLHLITPGQRLIAKITFRGTTLQNGNGLTRLSYETSENPERTKRVLYTRFGRFMAHLVFPCFDEPRFKATFSLKLINIFSQRTALSNAKLKQKRPMQHQRTMSVFRFEPTPPISPHQFGFAIGHFDLSQEIPIDSSPDGPIIRLVKTNGTKNVSEFANSTIQKVYKFLKEFFESDHPIRTLKILAFPGVGTELESNTAGLIITDVANLEPNTQRGETSTYTATLIKMIARQWFGFLLTLERDEQTWLFEGLINWTAIRLVDSITQGLSYQLVYAHSERAAALELEARPETQLLFPDAPYVQHPENSAAPNVVEPRRGEFPLDKRLEVKATGIISLYDESCNGRFRLALQRLMLLTRNKTVTLTKFFDALEDTCGWSLRESVRHFINNPGFPLIKAAWSNDNDLILSQEVFKPDFTALSPMQSITSPDTQLWFLPVSLRMGDVNEGTAKRRVCYRLPEIDIPMRVTLTEKYNINRPGTWLKINNYARGFYRVMYSDTILARLKRAISENHLSNLDCLNLIDDARALFRSAKVGAYYLVETMKALINQRNELVQDFMIDSYRELRALYLPVPQISEKIDTFGVELFGKIFEDRGFDLQLLTTQAGRSALGRIYEMLAVLDFQPLIYRSLALYRSPKLYEFDPIFHQSIFIAVARHGTEYDFQELLTLLKSTQVFGADELHFKLVKAFALSGKTSRLMDSWRSIETMKPQFIHHFIINLMESKQGSEFIMAEINPILINVHNRMSEEQLSTILETICIKITSRNVCDSRSPYRALFREERWLALMSKVVDVLRKNNFLQRADPNKLIL